MSGNGDSPNAAALFEAANKLRSYTQKLWMRVKRKAAYLPG
jgi:hypothetical protein